MNSLDASILGILSRRMSESLTAAQIGALKRPPLKGRECRDIQDRLQVMRTINFVSKNGPGWQITASGLQELDQHERWIKQHGTAEGADAGRRGLHHAKDRGDRP